ncbi:hypothetical protein H0H87_000765 [Tephrocybe sp. NHM501043]|nr:hypothetical protein H0H87_000765 [Tephrocybe sp. NHM501043]
MKQHDPRKLNPSIIRETLLTFYDRGMFDSTESSSKILILILVEILQWERDASPRMPCLIQSAEIETILVTLKLDLAMYPSAVDMAEFLLRDVVGEIEVTAPVVVGTDILTGHVTSPERQRRLMLEGRVKAIMKTIKGRRKKWARGRGVSISSD